MADPDRTVARTVAAALAAAGVAATMLLVGTSAVTAVATVVLAVGQAVLLRGAGGARRTRRFLLAASAQAGLTYPVAGAPTVASALVYLGVGVVFGLVVMAGSTFLDRVDPPAEEPRSDTRPLPVIDGP